MNAIYHTLWIKASKKEVFNMLTDPNKINIWWTLNCEGRPALNETYELFFGPGYEWKADVNSYQELAEFSLKFTVADKDWLHSIVRFRLTEEQDLLKLDFAHEGWPKLNEHLTRSSYCWAMYLTCLKKYLEFGQVHPYENRLNI